MAFSLEKLFVDVFAPAGGDIVTVMVDLPHDKIPDTPEWEARRRMAEEWRQEMARFGGKYGVKVNPMVSYEATGMSNSELPVTGFQEGRRVRLEDSGRDSTIILSMPEFSASAPLVGFTRIYGNLRVASLPGVTRAMQETGLSADYSKIARTCTRLAQLFDRSEAIEVLFSTGDTCTFDKSDHKPAIKDDGILHPGQGGEEFRFRNLPSGEVFIAPNENPDSKTQGTIPVSYGSEIAIFVVQNNQVIDVRGEGPMATKKRKEFREEKALRNIAEVAIGCNDRAVVTGNILEDEKAGFHWAYGRSDHVGATVDPQAFSAPDKVFHQDSVYTRGNPIVCKRLDFIFTDGTRKTAIQEGVLESETKLNRPAEGVFYFNWNSENNNRIEKQTAPCMIRLVK